MIDKILYSMRNNVSMPLVLSLTEQHQRYIFRNKKLKLKDILENENISFIDCTDQQAEYIRGTNKKGTAETVPDCE